MQGLCTHKIHSGGKKNAEQHMYVYNLTKVWRMRGIVGVWLLGSTQHLLYKRYRYAIVYV